MTYGNFPFSNHKSNQNSINPISKAKYARERLHEFKGGISKLQHSKKRKKNGIK
jgi:hypothetical protein